jgi:small subunit ribosomal protein S2
MSEDRNGLYFFACRIRIGSCLRRQKGEVRKNMSEELKTTSETTRTETEAETQETATPIVREAKKSSVLGEKLGLEVSMKALLDAGAHFGHQTQRWNPRMLPYIFGEKNGIHVINLDITLSAWQKTKKYVTDTVARGGNVLFVGTKDQIRNVVSEHAERCGAFYVTTRWLGGMLSNFGTIKRSIDRLAKLEEVLKKAQENESEMKLFKKKERLYIQREIEKLTKSLGGIRDMKRHPDLIVIIDINKEDIAVAEARKLHIPVVALVDTNTNPSVVDFPIPANDDSVKTVKLFVAGLADAIIEGKEQYRVRAPKGREARGEGKPVSEVTVETVNRPGDKKEAEESTLEVAAAS